MQYPAAVFPASHPPVAREGVIARQAHSTSILCTLTDNGHSRNAVISFHANDTYTLYVHTHGGWAWTESDRTVVDSFLKYKGVQAKRLYVQGLYVQDASMMLYDLPVVTFNQVVPTFSWRTPTGYERCRIAFARLLDSGSLYLVFNKKASLSVNHPQNIVGLQLRHQLSEPLLQAPLKYRTARPVPFVPTGAAVQAPAPARAGAAPPVRPTIQKHSHPLQRPQSQAAHAVRVVRPAQPAQHAQDSQVVRTAFAVPVVPGMQMAVVDAHPVPRVLPAQPQTLARAPVEQARARLVSAPQYREVLSLPPQNSALMQTRGINTTWRDASTNRMYKMLIITQPDNWPMPNNAIMSVGPDLVVSIYRREDGVWPRVPQDASLIPRLVMSADLVRHFAPYAFIGGVGGLSSAPPPVTKARLGKTVFSKLPNGRSKFNIMQGELHTDGWLTLRFDSDVDLDDLEFDKICGLSLEPLM